MHRTEDVAGTQAAFGAQLLPFVEATEERFPAVMQLLLAAEGEILTFYDVPAAHRRQCIAPTCSNASARNSSGAAPSLASSRTAVQSSGFGGTCAPRSMTNGAYRPTATGTRPRCANSSFTKQRRARPQDCYTGWRIQAGIRRARPLAQTAHDRQPIHKYVGWRVRWRGQWLRRTRILRASSRSRRSSI